MYTTSYYTKLLREGKISRRDFINKTVVVGASLPVAMSLTNQIAMADSPNKGGRFRQAITGGSTGDNLDPALIMDMYMANVSFGQLRNNLTEIGSDGNLIGELAESWDVSDDAMTWTFKLLKGVEFHNGKTLDAEDVVASINHHRGEDSKSAANSIVESIKDIRTDGKDVVIFELSGGSADFPYLLSDFHLSICPAKDGSIDWQSGVGTGGYVLESFEPGISTETRRNPNYWKEGRAHFDEIETLFMADVVARTSALQSGAIDAMTRVDLKTAHLLERNPELNVIQTTGNQHQTLPMLTNVTPFDNNDLRLAVKYAIDREQWLKIIANGYGAIANDHPIGPANTYYDAEIEQRTYDPDKSKFHLKKAGYDSVDLQLHTADAAFEGATDGGILLKESAA
ncbi:MAG: ABC transporter substrate-binding protein, partial [Rhodospirillales bacterium]|nr:ABC transporter substrate-binding protein [Rhodospirillales bacterium]